MQYVCHFRGVGNRSLQTGAERKHQNLIDFPTSKARMLGGFRDDSSCEMLILGFQKKCVLERGLAARGGRKKTRADVRNTP